MSGANKERTRTALYSFWQMAGLIHISSIFFVPWEKLFSLYCQKNLCNKLLYLSIQAIIGFPSKFELHGYQASI